MARWLPVPEYEGFYEVSDEGDVRSLDHVVLKRTKSGTIAEHRLRGRVLKSVWGNGQHSGHLSVTLSKKGKVTRFLIARMVLTSFTGPSPLGHESCHYDGNPANNRLGNLRWDTRAGNSADMARHGSRKGVKHPLAKLTDAKVRDIRQRYAAGEGPSSLGKHYGVTHTTIGRVVREKNWSHVA